MGTFQSGCGVARNNAQLTGLRVGDTLVTGENDVRKTVPQTLNVNVIIMNMDKVHRVLLVIVIIVGAVSYFAWHYTDWLNAMKPVDKNIEKRAAQKIRFDDWAYITKTKRLSDTEELSLLIVPSNLSKILDTKCFIYKNREFNQVVMTCPEARQDEIGDPSP